jgi:hypothetical protein
VSSGSCPRWLALDSLWSFGTDRTENTASLQQFFHRCSTSLLGRIAQKKLFNSYPIVAMALVLLRITLPLLSNGSFSGFPILPLRKYASIR